MNSAQYISSLQNPEDIDALNIKELEEIITEFPYFQSARALLLKGLNKTYSYKYNPTLKKTAAYTIDRKVLFDFITSPIFINKEAPKVEQLEEIALKEVETNKIVHNDIDSSTLTNKEKIEEEILIATETLEIGKPIPFSDSEQHSFNEWMQLVKFQPIIREDKTADKFNLIDTFIKTKPKIKPADKSAINIDLSPESSTENDSLMTETLAKVYLEQKKYENAIKAYHILSLKYPEKSGFFADRIKVIKILQRNKS
ncbi:MAG: hypothetical protein JKY16_06780 [Lutibacter sp.]|nr:hypothetical protein [Lutibacter sp.]